MNYCKRCVLPDTRPNLYINKNGICSACTAHENFKKINWSKKIRLFKNLTKKIKKKNNLYDCLIPVSGGKDSTWQCVQLLKLNLNPLTFTYKPVMRTKIGQKNLDNLKKLGIDHIDYSISELTEKKFLKKSFFKFGAVAIPMHMAMWNISFNLASMFKIPFIIWGENSSREYGGSKEDLKLKELNENWIKKYGINFNTKPIDWVDGKLTKKNMASFFKIQNNKKFYPKSIFLGDYFRWDPNKVMKIAKKHGFSGLKKRTKTGIYNYADIDDDLISIHHYLKIFKFGFSRIQDNLSLEIRNKRISRKKAVKIVNKKGFTPPMGDIKKFCNFIDIPITKFFDICEKFRNKKIWLKKNNKWYLKNKLR
jgi:N-acetyl sugar amidotransferase